MTQRSRAFLVALAAGAVGAAAAPARATFITPLDPDGERTYIDFAHCGSSACLGYVSANSHIDTSTGAPADTGSGYTLVTPSGASPPADPSFAPAGLVLRGAVLTGLLVIQWWRSV